LLHYFTGTHYSSLSSGSVVNMLDFHPMNLDSVSTVTTWLTCGIIRKGQNCSSAPDNSHFALYRRY